MDWVIYRFDLVRREEEENRVCLSFSHIGILMKMIFLQSVGIHSLSSKLNVLKVSPYF